MPPPQVRTTVAATVINAGVAANVLPPSGLINLNIRLLHGDNVDTVRTHLHKVLASLPARYT